MIRILTFFLLFPMILFVGGCAQRYSQEEYKALQSELDFCKKHNEESQTDNTRLNNDLKDALKKLEKSSLDITSSCSDKQGLLDKNIDCMEENKTLLKQISRFKVMTQEKKDAQLRLNKANEHLMNIFAQERMNDQLYIVKDEDVVKIIIPQKTLFPSPFSAWLIPKGTTLIKKIAKGVDELKPLHIEIAGHTDTTPIPKQAFKNFQTQWDLSHARAVSVLLVLEGMGIKKDKLSITSYGDTKPIAESNSDEGRAMNRRVEIILTP